MVLDEVLPLLDQLPDGEVRVLQIEVETACVSVRERECVCVYIIMCVRVCLCVHGQKCDRFSVLHALLSN